MDKNNAPEDVPCCMSSYNSSIFGILSIPMFM